MTGGFLVAIAVLGLPIFVIGWSLVDACGDDDAAVALAVGPAFAAVVLACSLVTAAGIGGLVLALTPALVALLALAVMIRRRRIALRRALAFPLAAWGGAIAVFAWPFDFRSGPGVLGYNIANDSAVHAVVVDHFARPGRTVAQGSTADAIISSFTADGYPLGVHQVIASVAAATGDVLTAYDSGLAVLVALTVFPAYWLSRRAGCPPPIAAIGGLAAAAGYLQLQYYQQGFAPQMAATPLVFCALGLGYEAAMSGRLVVALAAGVTLGGAVAVYSVSIAAYVGVGLLAMLVIAVAKSRGRRRVVPMQLAVIVVGAAIVLAPSLGPTIDFFRAAGGTLQQRGTTVAAGNLSKAADPKLALGAWIGPDFRAPYVLTRKTRAGMLAAAFLSAIALVATLARRRFALPIVLGSIGFASLYITQRSGIYYAAKSYQMLAVPIACAVAVGGWTLISWRSTVIGRVVALLGVVLLTGWLYVADRSLLYSARAAAITPPDIRELRQLREPGLGIALIPDDWAKFALPNASVPQDRSTSSALTQLREGGGAAGWLDSDSMSASTLARASWIVEYRMGGTSTPPPPFALVREIGSYRLWRRPAGSKVAPGLLPFEPAGTLGGLALAPGARHPLKLARAGRSLLSAQPAGATFWSPVRWRWQGTGWGPWVANPAYVVAQADGPSLGHAFAVAAAGRYRVTMIGLPGPTMRVVIDGHPYVAEARSIDARQLVATVDLAAGTHTIELRHGAGGGVSYILALALEPERHDNVATICIDGARRTVSALHPVAFNGGPGSVVTNCGRFPVRLDWVIGPVAPAG